MDPKPVTYENKKYLDFIRSKPCLLCNRPAEPHHVRRSYWGAGVGKKPHDYVAIPFCRECHDPKNEVGVMMIIIKYLMEYIEKQR